MLTLVERLQLTSRHVKDANILSRRRSSTMPKAILELSEGRQANCPLKLVEEVEDAS